MVVDGLSGLAQPQWSYHHVETVLQLLYFHFGFGRRSAFLLLYQLPFLEP